MHSILSINRSRAIAGGTKLLFALGCSLSISLSVYAQEEPEQTPPMDTLSTSEVAVSNAHPPDEAKTHESPRDPQFEQARSFIEQGLVNIKDEKYEAALAELEHAYQLLNGHPRQCELLFNIGLCRERLSRYGRALASFEGYLRECGPAAPKAKEALQIIDVLKHLLGTLRISVNVAAQVWVDDVLVGQAPGELYVSGGRHTVELRVEGYESVQSEVSVASRTVVELTFELEKISQYKGISPLYFGSTLALGVISAGIGAYFGIQALSESSQAEDNRLKTTEETIDRIDDFTLTADIFFAVAGALALASGVLFFLTDWSGEETEQPSTVFHRSMQMMATPNRHGATLHLTGRF